MKCNERSPLFIGGDPKPSAIDADTTPILVTSAENGLELKIITHSPLNQQLPSGSKPWEIKLEKLNSNRLEF
jgi:hypothetical protein